MKLGFTGTQEGMTEAQKKAFMKFLHSHEVTEFHHGDCIGADAQAHMIVAIQENIIPIVVHPPLNPSKRAFSTEAVGSSNMKVLPPKEYLTRNRDIVNTTDILFAAPAQEQEQLRSGTWSTVRYARKVRKKVIIVGPEGKIERIP